MRLNREDISKIAEEVAVLLAPLISGKKLVIPDRKVVESDPLTFASRLNDAMEQAARKSALPRRKG